MDAERAAPIEGLFMSWSVPVTGVSSWIISYLLVAISETLPV